jgi:ribosomal protein L7/L12
MNELDKMVFVSYLTGMVGRQLETFEIERLFNRLPPTKCNIDVLNELMQAISNGRKLDAIKAHRTLTGFGLRESKDAVERYWPHIAVNTD